MRVALLSMIETTRGDEGDVLRGLLPFGGRSVVRGQIDLVLALRCQRIICLSEGVPAGIIALQHVVEKAGAEFHVIAGRRNLPSLVHATDELIVLADGLLPLADEALAPLETGHAVLVLPVEAGIALGFERIDLNYAWAGASAMPGSLVERLFELPEDADIIAALLRIALQSRVPPSPIPDAALADRRWALIRSPADAGLCEKAWLRRQALPSDPFSPGRWVAGLFIASFGPRLIQRRIGSLALAGSALLWAIGACVLGAFALVTGGLVVFAISALILGAGTTLRKLESGGRGRGGALFTVLHWLFDAILALLLVYGLADEGNWQTRIFLPLVALGLVNLLPKLTLSRWASLVEDRVVLSVILAVVAANALLIPALQLLILLLLGLAMGITRRAGQLTRG